MKAMASLLMVLLVTGPLCAQEARESALDAQPFKTRVQRAVEEFSQRQQARQKRIQRLEATAAEDAGLQGMTTILELRVKIDMQQDLLNTVLELHEVYTSQTQKVDNALARNAQMQGRFQAQIAQGLADLQKLAERTPELRTSLQNLSKLDASPDTNQLISKVDAELTRIEREHNKVQATVANFRQELKWAAADRDKLEAIGGALRQRVGEFGKLADSARQTLTLLADRGEFLVQHARIQTLLDESTKGVEMESLVPQLQTLAGDAELPGVSDGSATGKSNLDPDKFRACVQQGGEVNACRRAAGGQ